MAEAEQQIICRRCSEKISMEGGSCPHCGTGIRRRIVPIGMIVIGVATGIFSLLQIGELYLFFVFSIVVTVIGVVLFRSRRRRIREANQPEQDA